MIFRTRVQMLAVVLLAGTIVGLGPRLAISADAQPQKLPGSDIIPAERLTDWRPGVTVGVPGGIPTDRNKLIDVTKEPYNADNTGATDAHEAIQKAVGDAKDKDVVYLPAGTYRMDLGVRLKSNITVRGDGPDKTVIMFYGPGGGALNILENADWTWGNEVLNITGSPAKGQTVLNVGDTKALDAYPNGGIGQICRLVLKNDLTLPVVSPAHWEDLRRQMTRVVAKTPTTVTISPGLLFDLPESLSPRIKVATRQAEFVGIEDLKIDGANSKSAWLIYMEQCYGCWVKNVAVVNVLGYHINLMDIFQCEVRHCYIAKRMRAGSNGAGILTTLISCCLIEDNILVDQFPNIEVNHGSTGNVFAYNYCYGSLSLGDLAGVDICSNHGPHNSYNLYEGNAAEKFQSDGYHGSASQDTVFRNWFRGKSDKLENFWICVNLNRFTREYNIVGNVLGCKGYPWLYEVELVGFSYDKHFIYSLGYPNCGNGWSNAKTVQPSKGIYWADWDTMLAADPGKGPGPNGFQELDLDVKATTLLKGNYNYKDNAVPESESLKGKKLPASLYLEKKPEWFGNLTWPPFGPDTKFEENKIPAQVRFEAISKAAKDR